MTVDEFFTSCIMDTEGHRIKDVTTFVKVVDGIPMRIAHIDHYKALDMLWVSWPVFYQPLIDHFGMTEQQVTDFIKSKMNVDLVGFMPSFHRLFRSIREHSEENKLIDYVNKKQ